MTDIATILSSGALSSLIVFLFRNWISERIKNSIQHEYDQKLETHKAQLKAESDIVIEKLKSELQTASTERSIKLTKVFEEQARVIAETYKRLHVLRDAADACTSANDQERIESLKRFREMMVEFRNYYLPIKIYIPKDSSKKIEEFHYTLESATRKFQMANQYAALKSVNTEPFERLMSEYSESWDKILGMLQALEEDFQKILGFPIQK